LWVTPEFFKVFGITRVEGRAFTDDDRGTSTIVLGRGVWERRFAADRTLIGSSLNVNMINLSRTGATPHIVLGFVPVDVHFPPLTADFSLGAVNSMAVGGVDQQIDFWQPLFLGEAPRRSDGGGPRRDDRTLDVVAKLRPGVTLAHAQAEMAAVARSLADTFPATNRNWSVQVVPLRTQILGGTRRVVLLLSLATVLVLAIACGNVSTLLLARGLARQTEASVRSALGASRLRIAKQFLIESLLIALGAAALAVGMTSLGLTLLTPWFPADVPLIHGARINGPVLAFAVAIAVVTACLTGIVPAWMSSSASDMGSLTLRGHSRGRRPRRAMTTLVTAQVALTMVLLVSTGLLFRSAVRLWAIEPGFTSTNVLTMTISLPNNKFEWQHNVVFSKDVVSAVRASPLVTDAAVIQGVPMRPGGFWTTFSVEGMPATTPGELPVAHMRVISPDYFRVMQIPLLDGRIFDERDNVGERGHPQFVIVNRALATRYWPGQSAAGKRIRTGPDGSVMIAGVVGDVRYRGLETPPEMEIYLPEGLFPQSAITLLVETATNPLAVAVDIRARIAQVDREAFVTDVRTMDGLIDDSLASRSFATLLLALCAGIGLILAMSGIYGIIAQAVVQRTFEIGVRLALGATPRQMVRLMVQHSVVPVAAGTLVGLLATTATARLLSAMLFGIHRFDPATCVAAAGLLVVVAFVAALPPARRATAVDPLVALRCE
jgi:predicted permease